MSFRSRIQSFSFVFFTIVLIVNGLNFSFDLGLAEILALNPQMLLENYQFWRFLTYPFVLTNPEFIFFFGAIFILASPMLENYLNKYIYPIFLFLATMLQGFILTLVLWNRDVSIGGIEGLAFFVLLLLMFLKPDLKIFRRFSLTTAAFGLVVILMWVVMLVPLSESASFSFAEKASSALFGIGFGLSIYFPIRYMQNLIDKRKKSTVPIEPIKIPKPEELSVAMISSANLKKIYHQFEDEVDLITEDPETNEEILNTILEKIHQYGKDSLKSDELKFLEDYSKRI